MMPLAERVIMISGASRGIGLAVARRLLHAGACLSLGVRDKAAAEDALGAGNAQAVSYFPYSAVDPESAENWIAGTLETFGRLDGLVNNAGVSGPQFALTDVDETGLDEIVADSLSPVSSIEGVFGGEFHKIVSVFANGDLDFFYGSITAGVLSG